MVAIRYDCQAEMYQKFTKNKQGKRLQSYPYRDAFFF